MAARPRHCPSTRLLRGTDVLQTCAWYRRMTCVTPTTCTQTLFKTCEVVEDRFAIPTREMPTGLVLVGDIDSSAAK